MAAERTRRGEQALVALGLTGGLAALVLAVALQGPAGGAAEAAATPGEPDAGTPEGDPQSARYWRYCAIDGFLASCCGGTATSCPPGTEMSTITWLGTCRNPADGRDYVVSYNDCCGKAICGRCFANRNEDDMPVYFAPKSNDINWCMGSESSVYNSTVAVIVGTADGGAP